MGKSFVMKRPDGSLAGYLMQEGDGTVCFRAHALPEKGASLTLLFEGGTQADRAVSGERETAWSERSAAVEAAFVCAGGKLLMSTGERGRKAFEAALERGEAANKATNKATSKALNKTTNKAMDKAPNDAPDQAPVKTEACEKAACTPSGHALPERRWPPPPCMPGARYEEGRWRT